MSKQRVIVEAVLAGKSQREVARLYGISQPRVSQLMAAYRAGGWQGLEPRSRRPRTNPNATTPAVVERVLALRTELVVDGAWGSTSGRLVAAVGHDPLPGTRRQRASASP